MRRLVVLGAVRGVVWVSGGGRCCHVWVPVMGFLLLAAGGDTRVGVCRRRLRVAGVREGLRVVRQWSGPGGGAGGG